VIELPQRHAHGKPVASHINCSHHTAVSQLSVDKIAVENVGRQRVVGFDAAHKVQLSRANVGYEVAKLRVEFLSQRGFVFLRAARHQRGSRVFQQIHTISCQTVDGSDDKWDGTAADDKTCSKSLVRQQQPRNQRKSKYRYQCLECRGFCPTTALWCIAPATTVTQMIASQHTRGIQNTKAQRTSPA
jgi:hypothetical protein